MGPVRLRPGNAQVLRCLSNVLLCRRARVDQAVCERALKAQAESDSRSRSRDSSEIANRSGGLAGDGWRNGQLVAVPGATALRGSMRRRVGQISRRKPNAESLTVIDHAIHVPTHVVAVQAVEGVSAQLAHEPSVPQEDLTPDPAGDVCPGSPF